MKLTDEQREEIQRSVNLLGTQGITPRGLELLLSSEQAWKEEATRANREIEDSLHSFQMMELEVAKAKARLNQAVEVLKKIGSIVSQDQKAMEASRMANDFLFILSKGETKEDKL